MKSKESIVEILEAYDLMGSFRGAASLMGCSHHTVQRLVEDRAAGKPDPVRRQTPRLTDPFEAKIAEWVERSDGKIRGDVVHHKLALMGYAGARRTTNYAVRRAKMLYAKQTVRVHRPWVTEPGMWAQYDFGDGPVIDGTKTVLFLGWLSWSRFRVVIPLRNRQMPSVLTAIDAMFRLFGGTPTYVLSDNEKTLTTGHIAGLPMRNRQMVDFGEHYSVTFHSCVPYDPASKGGVERSVAIAKADLVPTDTNLLGEYASFSDLEAACREFMNHVNQREHSVTKRWPADMLAEELECLHPLPENAFPAVLGSPRRVPPNTPMVTFEHAQYSVPHHLLGQTVYVRHDEAVRQVVVFAPGQTVTEVARHPVTAPGNPAIDDTHFPEPRRTPLDRKIRPRGPLETEFVGIGEGAKQWLREATSQGIGGITQRMGRAIGYAKTLGIEPVDRALGLAAIHHRFRDRDFTSILENAGTNTTTRAADQNLSLAQGTSGWAAAGTETQA